MHVSLSTVRGTATDRVCATKQHTILGTHRHVPSVESTLLVHRGVTVPGTELPAGHYKHCRPTYNRFPDMQLIEVSKVTQVSIAARHHVVGNFNGLNN